jgi:hypothetical protein
MNDLMGRTVADKITGFAGVVTAHIEYLSGCHQSSVNPGLDKDGKPQENQWFDDQRLVVDERVDRVLLDNSKTPGFGEPAPAGYVG